MSRSLQPSGGGRLSFSGGGERRGRRGWKRQSSLGSYHCSLSIGTGLLNPFASIESISRTLMLAILASDSSSLFYVQWVLFREEFRWGAIVDSPYTPWLSMIMHIIQCSLRSLLSLSIFQRERKMKLKIIIIIHMLSHVAFYEISCVIKLQSKIN